MTTAPAPGARKAIPTLRGVEDLAFTVPDLDEATAFFGAVFGAVVVAESGAVADRRRSSMRAFANADVRTVVRGSRLLRTPFLNLELIEAEYPGQRVVWLGMEDIGGWHLAGYVDDMDAAIEFLAHTDVYILGPGKKPTTNAPEVGEGSYACHCMTAWGFHFELLTYPKGRAYMAQFARRLWNPGDPDAGATPRTPPFVSIPGFRGFEHLSIAVADIEEASVFFEGVLDCERFYDMGPLEDPHGSGFGAYVNVDVRIKASKVRLFRSPYLNFELVETMYPGQNRLWPHVFDVGGWRITFSAGDIDAALEHLASADVHVLGGKREEAASGSTTRRDRVSCLAPFGLYFDLISGPPDPPEPAASGMARWDPAYPDR